MDLTRIEKKLREAGFFLDQMRDRESNAYGDKEEIFIRVFERYSAEFIANAKRKRIHQSGNRALAKISDTPTIDKSEVVKIA